MAKKLKWFKFFFIYKEAFEELSPRNCKKLICNMIDYAEYGMIPKKMNKKVMERFNSFKSFYDADIELYKIYGAKGGRKPIKGRFENTKPRVKGRLNTTLE